MNALDIILNVGIVICGWGATWFVGRPEGWRRWGYILGLCGQPFWIGLSIYHELWGVLLMCALYSYSWGQGVWFWWVKPWLTGTATEQPA